MHDHLKGTSVAVEQIAVSAYRVPTDLPEADGTIAWHNTTLVLVAARAGGQTGLGYTYADLATATLIRDTLADVVRHLDALAVPTCWQQMALRSATLRGAHWSKATRWSP